MAEKLSREQLEAALEDGDEFEFDDDGRRSIEGFSELVAELRALVAAQRANAGADMLRSESMSELIALLQKIVSRPAGQMDMTPLRDMLAEMTTIRREHVAFEFSVVRDNRGFMQKITATPVAPTQH